MSRYLSWIDDEQLSSFLDLSEPAGKPKAGHQGAQAQTGGQRHPAQAPQRQVPPSQPPVLRISSDQGAWSRGDSFRTRDPQPAQPVQRTHANEYGVERRTPTELSHFSPAPPVPPAPAPVQNFGPAGGHFQQTQQVPSPGAYHQPQPPVQSPAVQPSSGYSQRTSKVDAFSLGEFHETGRMPAFLSSGVWFERVERLIAWVGSSYQSQTVFLGGEDGLPIMYHGITDNYMVLMSSLLRANTQLAPYIEDNPFMEDGSGLLFRAFIIPTKSNEYLQAQWFYTSQGWVCFGLVSPTMLSNDETTALRTILQQILEQI